MRAYVLDSLSGWQRVRQAGDGRQGGRRHALGRGCARGRRQGSRAWQAPSWGYRGGMRLPSTQGPRRLGHSAHVHDLVILGCPAELGDGRSDPVHRPWRGGGRTLASRAYEGRLLHRHVRGLWGQQARLRRSRARFVCVVAQQPQAARSAAGPPGAHPAAGHRRGVPAGSLTGLPRSDACVGLTHDALRAVAQRAAGRRRG